MPLYVWLIVSALLVLDAVVLVETVRFVRSLDD